MTTTPNHLSLSLLEELFNEPFGLFAPLKNQPGKNQATGVEWFEDDEHYYVRLDVPGLSKEDIELEFEASEVRLAIKVEGKEKSSRLQIPEGILIESAEANLVDGVLTLQLPKSPDKQPVTIEVL